MRPLRPSLLVACAVALLGTTLVSGQTTARIGTVAGTGTAGLSGDGGAATAAQLATPSDVAFMGGNATFLIADTANHRVRRVGDDGLSRPSPGRDRPRGRRAASPATRSRPPTRRPA
jgi:hypothetical protein